MKKGKILSLLTSLAVTGSMILSAVPSLTASAADCPVGLKMVSDKTEYSLDEIKTGNAKATVYVDSSATFSANDEVASMSFRLVPEEWGKVDPINLQICKPNAFSNDKGNQPRHFNGAATMTVSEWDQNVAKPTSPGYGVYDVIQDGGKYGEGDTTPFVGIVSDSTRGYIKSDAANAANHVAQFDVYFPADLEAGTYTINFVDAQAAIKFTTADVTSSLAPITNLTPITFTIGDGTATTTAVTTAATDVTTKKTVGTTLANVYDGKVKISAEAGVKGEVGQTVEVPLYFDTFGRTTEGMSIMFEFDKDALELVEIADPLDYTDADGNYIYEVGGFDGGSFTAEPSTAVLLYNWMNGDITNNPDVPVAILKFQIKDGASGEYPIKLLNPQFPDEPIDVIYKGDTPTTPNIYLKPDPVLDGSIIVGDAPVTTVASTTQKPTHTTLANVYDGKVKISAEAGVKGEVGQTVEVPLYFDTFGRTTEGMSIMFEFDKDALELVEIVDPLDYTDADGNYIYEVGGFDGGSFTAEASTAVLLYNWMNGDITNNPDVPVAILRFQIKDGASGEYPIKLLNPQFPDEPIDVIYKGDTPTTPNIYLEPDPVLDGSIIVGDAPVTTTAKTTAVTTSSAVSDTDISVVTSVSVVTSNQINTSVSVVTSNEIHTSVSVVTSNQINTTVSVVTSNEIHTSVSVVTSNQINTTVSVVTSNQINTTVSVVTSNEIHTTVSVVTSNQINTTVSVVTSNQINTTVSVVTSNQIHTITSLVTFTSIIGGDQTTVATSGSGVTTSSAISGGEGGDQTTVATSGSGVTTSSAISGGEATVSIDLTELVAEGKDNNWYFADEKDWHESLIVVRDAEGNAIDASEYKLTFDKATPGDAYDFKTFDYEITVTCTYGDQTVEAKFNAKIGQRGDTDCSHKVDVRDAAAIAKDLAQIPATKSTKLTKEDKFGIFLGNSDYVFSTNPEPGKNGVSKKTTDWYGNYDLTARDAATLAKYLAKKPAQPDLTLRDVAIIAK